MSIVIVTGSAGLIGAQTVLRFHELGHDVWGIDNDMRALFFGPEASTRWMAERLGALPRYRHHDLDIRDAEGVDRLFAGAGRDLALVVHTAAQPSHDWAAREPQTDFTVNANGTLALLEATRKHRPSCPFIFTSTNKVYGDTPNRLPLVELEARYELAPEHPYYARGIDESMSIDASTHSLFGVSKVAADLLVQEYGRYFDIPTACFRGGCLTGPGHSGAELHGFLAYLMKCAVAGRRYTVYGYKGKQVRDNIHSADLVAAFEHFAAAPRQAAVYNIGGSRHSNCSMREAIVICERLAGRPLDWAYAEQNRVGDHIWWVSDVSRFERDYPGWRLTYDLERILGDIYGHNVERWRGEAGRG